MKSLTSLFLFAVLGASFTGCAYYERDQVVPARAGYAYDSRNDSYYPVRAYDSHWDYYRHYNGIDG